MTLLDTVDGRRVGRFAGGAMHLVPVPRGTHWVRAELDGPPTGRSAVAVAHHGAP